MNRYLIPVTLIVALASVGTASAQYPGSVPTPPPPQYGPPPGAAPVEYGPVYDAGYGPPAGGRFTQFPNYKSPYGWNRPLLRMMWNKRDKNDCPGSYGGHGGHGGAGAVQGPPVQGTLVFPKHPFARSPRDFFMVN